jgi:hypothetical protein
MPKDIFPQVTPEIGVVVAHVKMPLLHSQSHQGGVTETGDQGV